jgi:hypothetical protein
MNRVLYLILVTLAIGCGNFSSNPYAGAVGCPGNQSCSKLCATWAGAQPLGTNRFAGSRYCSSNVLYVQYDRFQPYSAVAAGTYPTETTGAPCSFTVGAACSFTEN